MARTSNTNNDYFLEGYKCSRCKIHGFTSLRKGHTNICKFRNCVCYKCELLQQKIDHDTEMSRERKWKRAMKRALETHQTACIESANQSSIMGDSTITESSPTAITFLATKFIKTEDSDKGMSKLYNVNFVIVFLFLEFFNNISELKENLKKQFTKSSNFQINVLLGTILKDNNNDLNKSVEKITKCMIIIF